MKIRVCDYLADFLAIQKIEQVFEVAGGMITYLLDSLHQRGKIQIVSMHHEQSAAFAADAVGRVSRKPGVALATSGPGATNLLTGIASCYFDSSPALFITGQVNTHEQKGLRKIRQLGFQETDIVSMATAITKKCYRVESAEQVESILHEAFTCAISGRPGPVLIDLPMNIQRDYLIASPIKVIQPQLNKADTLILKIGLLQESIRQAKRPLILLGGGVRAANAEKDLLQFAALTGIPVVTSLLALDTIPFSHPLRVGFIGTYGNRWANIALSRADLVIVIGSRLDVRQTGADVNGFKQNKTIFHIDCDEHEINNRIEGCIAVVADAKAFLIQTNKQLESEKFPEYPHWLEEIQTLRISWPAVNELKDFAGINPNYFMQHLSLKSAAHTAGYVADVGNHQMWAAQSLAICEGQIFITSGGMGAMGFALPAAIGQSLALGKKPIVVIAGDGAFQMNIQELQTIVRNNIPLKIIVINNNCLGMIRQFQDSYFEGRYQSTYWGYTAPDFQAIAAAYGIAAKTISTTEEIDSSTSWLWEDNEKPALLQVMVNPKMNVYPKIAFGRPMHEMEPFAKPLMVEST